MSRRPTHGHPRAVADLSGALASAPFWAAVVAAALCGCGGAPERADDAVPIPAYRAAEIDTIELVGVTAFSKDALLGALHLRESSWVPFSPEAPFDRAWAPAEVARVEALYRQAGFPRARVLALDVASDDGGQTVRLTLRVEEGPRTRVRTLRMDWPAGVDAALRGAVEGRAALKVGEPFTVAELNDTLGTLRQALRARGFPHAQVTGGAEVYDDALAADVALRLVPGPHARIGGFRFEGLVSVPEERVRREIDFALGLEDTPAVESRVERAASGLDVFRWVTVEPAAEVVDGRVPLLVKVAEMRPQAVRLGVGLTFEAHRWEERASVQYTHLNLFGDLTRLDLKLLGGYAQLPSPFGVGESGGPSASGPMVEIAPELTRKGLFEPYLTWTLRPSFEVGIEEGYQYWSPSNRLGVSRWFAGRYRAQASHNVRFLRFFNLSPDLDATKSILGRDFRDPYLLSFAELQTDAFFTDDVLAPQNGVALGLTYDLAGGPFGGDFDHHKVVGDARAFWRPVSRIKLAAHAQTGLVFGGGTGAPTVPFDRRLYLGGADSVRGFGQRRLSPMLFDCAPEETCNGLPVGGLTSVLGTLQAQGRVAGPVWLLAFLDAGDVRPGEGSYAFDRLNYAAGPGLRVETPVGLVRLDVGFRLNTPGDFPQEPGWAAHFGLGESL